MVYANMRVFFLLVPQAFFGWATRTRSPEPRRRWLTFAVRWARAVRVWLTESIKVVHCCSLPVLAMTSGEPSSTNLSHLPRRVHVTSLLGTILLQGKRVCFVSNNSGKSRKEYMAKLNAQGIEAHEVSRADKSLAIFDHCSQEAVID